MKVKHQLSESAKNELKQLRRLIRVNNKLMAQDSQCTQNAKFLGNCRRINELLNGNKYCVSIGMIN